MLPSAAAELSIVRCIQCCALQASGRYRQWESLIEFEVCCVGGCADVEPRLKRVLLLIELFGLKPKYLARKPSTRLPRARDHTHTKPSRSPNSPQGGGHQALHNTHNTQTTHTNQARTPKQPPRGGPQAPEQHTHYQTHTHKTHQASADPETASKGPGTRSPNNTTQHTHKDIHPHKTHSTYTGRQAAR